MCPFTITPLRALQDVLTSRLKSLTFSVFVSMEAPLVVMRRDLPLVNDLSRTPDYDPEYGQHQEFGTTIRNKTIGINGIPLRRIQG